MSNIEEVRAAERKMQDILEKLRQHGGLAPQNLDSELKKATDEYAKAVRELVILPQTGDEPS